MTLRQLLAAHPERFIPQTWYFGEAFLDLECPSAVRVPTFTPCAYPNGQELPRAAMLAALYLAHQDATVWGQYFWCKDTDHTGQRVFVGGVGADNGHRFEIHRHLRVTARWGLATW